MFKLIIVLSMLTGTLAVHAQETRRVWLDSLDIHYFAEGLRPVSARTSYKSAEPIRINGVAYSRGVGVQTVSGLFMYLDGHARRFTAAVGADDQANKEIPVKFYVIGDGKILFESGEMRVGDAARRVHWANPSTVVSDLPWTGFCADGRSAPA